MLDDLKRRVCEANRLLAWHGLAKLTWGNVSGIYRQNRKGEASGCPTHADDLIVIKPSGVPYDELTPGDMAVVGMDGRVVEGRCKPSSDTPTHLRLYEAFPGIGGITHTHSAYATAFAQAGRGIPAYGTTHADYFYGEIPCARALTDEEVQGKYEWETGNVIAKTFGPPMNPHSMPGVLVKHHGPFTWGHTPEEAVCHAVVLEEIARMAWLSESISPGLGAVPQPLLDKHYLRKHGLDAYYGQ
jgi:L-ribulose-5-phosphate 4-epimerase